jgi:uncharacterized membrane protein YebE (DUF533 family)
MSNRNVLTAIEVWIAAAWADGVIQEVEAAAIKAVIGIAKLTDEERETALGWLDQKIDLEDVNVSQLERDDRVNIYAAALGVVAIDEQVGNDENRFLERLQIALQLDDATVASLRTRTGV